MLNSLHSKFIQSTTLAMLANKLCGRTNFLKHATSFHKFSTLNLSSSSPSPKIREFSSIPPPSPPLPLPLPLPLPKDKDWPPGQNLDPKGSKLLLCSLLCWRNTTGRETCHELHILLHPPYSSIGGQVGLLHRLWHCICHGGAWVVHHRRADHQSRPSVQALPLEGTG